MFNEKGFDDFINNMKEEMNKHDYIYGSSWKKEQIQFLEQRFKSKYNEFVLTKNPKKLVSMANLAMILKTRLDGDLND